MEIAIKAEKKGFSAYIPELHISTEGETLDEVVKNMQEAIELYYEEEKNYNKKLLKNGKLYFNMENFKHAINYKVAA